MFTVSAEEIDRLDGKELVELLRALVHAEARSADIPLSGVNVPLQVTIADGGEDGSVLWHGGKPSTSFLPCRDVVFQCKATDHGDAQWTKEVWTKKSQPKRVTKKELSPAISGALLRGAAYIGVTGSPRVKDKIAAREQAIREGIEAAGGDPAHLASIQVFDGNKLMAWANAHPAVALWIRERAAGFSLSTFGTLERWGKRTVLTMPPFVAIREREFSTGPLPNQRLRFDALGAHILDHLVAQHACVRIWGPSGLGKTRALYEALVGATGTLLDVSTANLIFCDWRESAAHVFDVAHHLKNAGTDAILVVDSCPLDDARVLVDLAREADSLLRIVTIGTEGREDADDCMMIRALPDKATCHGILEAALPQTPAALRETLVDHCDGYPAHALLFSSAGADNWGVKRSLGEIAERLIAERTDDADTVRALECLALFDWLGPDSDPQAFDALCEDLVQMRGALVYEHLVKASARRLVERNYDRLSVSMDLIANFLASRRLAHLRPSSVQAFLQTASPQARDAMLSRWQSLDERSPTAVAVVRDIVLRGWLGDDRVLSDAATPYLVAFVHADPDTMLRALSYAVHVKTIDDLATLDVNGALLDALRLLASMPRTFPYAVPVVIKLAAASDLARETPIVQLLRQLFQVALSGTGADEQKRRHALLEALEEADPRMRRACVEALGAMLTTHMTRFGDFDGVGGEPFEEWHPDDAQVLGYFRWALEKLLGLWRTHADLRGRIEEIVAGDLRILVEFDILDLVETFAREIAGLRGHWFDATHSIGDWLYFDRPAEENDRALAIRALYDLTLPSDPVDQVLLYSRYWSTDIHDPDTRYAADSDNPDHEYPARRVQALAPGIAADPKLLSRAIDVMAGTYTNTPFPFADALAQYLADPLDTFAKATKVLDRGEGRTGIGFVRALLTSLDRRLIDDTERDDALVAIARGSSTLFSDEMDIYTALRMTDARVRDLAADIRAGKFDLRRVVPISYGRGLDATPHDVLAELIDALTGRVDDHGAWTAVEILNMVTHGKQDIAPEILDLLKRVVLAPPIADGPADHVGHAEHSLEALIKRLARGNAIDATFARGFAGIVTRSCQSAEAQVRIAEALRKSLVPVVDKAPLEVWDVLSTFYEGATRYERERLGRILAPTQPYGREVGRSGPGLLFKTPESALLTWVNADPEARLGFVLSFYPILVQKDETWVWHPALERLASRYGASPAFRAALRARIFPRSWSGSLGGHLASFLAPLASWEAHAALGEWSERMRTDIESRSEGEDD